MNEYERYSSRELFEAANAGPENLRNYLISLLVKREDREPFIKQGLRGGKKEVVDALLRLLEASDVDRFRQDLEQWVKTGDAKLKRTIVDKWGQVRAKSAVPALIAIIKDREEDLLLIQMAIFSLGEIGDGAATAALSASFDEAEADTKIAILIALNKIGGEGARMLLLRASKDPSPIVRRWAVEFLDNSGRGEISDEGGIRRTWTRDPTSFPDRDRLSFFANGEGYYEEDKAGEQKLSVDFHYRLENSDHIVFVSGNNKEFRSGYEVRKTVFRHPYKGNIPCLTLEFTHRNIAIDRITLTGSPYYFLPDDIT